MEAPASESAQPHEQAERAEHPRAGQHPPALDQRGDGRDRDGGREQRVAGIELIVMRVERIVAIGERLGLGRKAGGFAGIAGDVGVEVADCGAGDGRRAEGGDLDPGGLGDVELGPGRLILVPAIDRVRLGLIHGLDDVAVLDRPQAHRDGEDDDGDRHRAVEPFVLCLGADFDFHAAIFPRSAPWCQ